ncbi:class I SAM-dependent methyltransferase [Bordetella tumulicola]|uniref:class I SAM-dependent methyltransferase n=1 Tax=Bordetella tumulicola TaxID=1649133 RepID=UPI0039F0F134
MTEETSPIVELAEWFQTPPGQHVLAWERAQFDAILVDVFGYYAWQVGLAEINFLQANRMPFKGWVGSQMPTPDEAARWRRCVVAQPDALPFESQSVDLLVLPHAFECTNSPHEVLREAERVLMPEGRLVISGFNPWSLWGARNRMPGMEPWLPHPPSAQVSLPRLKDWLKLLSFEVGPGRFGCYTPACRTEKWLQRWHFMETYGKRWWALGGAVYVVSAVKHVAGMRLVGPAWKTKKRRRTRAASVVVNRQAGSGKT